MKRWVRLTIRVPEADQDAVIGALSSSGLSGFVQEDEHIECYVDRRRWTPGKREEIRRALQNAGRATGRRLAFSVSSLADQNWNALWESTVDIVRPTPRIVIKPHWHKLPRRDRGKIILHIDPKMSFGTGHHETTRLCLRMLDRYIKRGMRVLDFGTGTGVLAIAAAKLGAGSVIAVDNDRWSYDNADENVRRNRVGRRVRVKLGSGSTLPTAQFHLAAANVDLPTIRRFLPRLLRSLRPQGILVLSGLLVVDLVPTLELLRHPRVIPLLLTNEREWIALAVRRD